MKLILTLEQWLELAENKRELFCKELNIRRVDVIGMPNQQIRIGHIIEFLGEDLVTIENFTNPERVENLRFWQVVDNTALTFQSKELCVALWEKAKHKLNQ